MYLACVYSVGAVRQSNGMRFDGPVGIGIAWNRLSSLVLLGCTALMRANSPKHPSGCLQFAQMGERMEEGAGEDGMYVGGGQGEERWDVCKEGEERMAEGLE